MALMLYGSTAPDAELVILYGNCQIPFLAHQLACADVNPRPRGYLCVLNHAASGQVVEQPSVADLARCVLYLEQYEYRPRAEVRELLRSGVPAGCPKRVFPPLVMHSLWPFDVVAQRMPPDARFVWGRYPMGDAIGLEVAALGLEIGAAVEAYWRLSAERMPDLNALLAHDLDRMDQRDLASDVKIADHVRENFRNRHLFWTNRQVSIDLIGELGARLYRASLPVLGGDEALGLERIRLGLPALGDGMGDLQVPIHPQIARTFDLDYVDETTRYRWYDQRWTFHEYLRHYLAADSDW